MSSYQITLKDRTTERIDGADAYQQEGQMTTFFQTGSGRNVVDTWSTRLASFRTSEVVIIRRLETRPAELATVGSFDPLAVDARA
ncbi:hypothetical protein BH10ACT1_BH10ACT1_14060 [soil metagenome]